MISSETLFNRRDSECTGIGTMLTPLKLSSVPYSSPWRDLLWIDWLFGSRQELAAVFLKQLFSVFGLRRIFQALFDATTLFVL